MAIGERLREARMRQKIDIADVEAATKIRAKYLRALENEEFGLLPGHTFVKTFLRTYAEHLGLDPQLLLEEYRAEYEPRGEDMQPYAVAARQRPPRERRHVPGGPSGGPPGTGTALIVLVGVVLVVLAILGLTGGGNDNTPSSSATTAQQPKKRPVHKKRAAPAATTVKLRVAPASATYVCVDRGPGTPVVDERTLTSAARYRGKRLRVNLGNSSARVTANGKRVPMPASPDAVGYDFKLRSGKVSWDTIPLGQRPCA